MLYGMEAVTVPKRQESKMKAAEIKMMTRMDEIWNEDISKTVGVDELGGKLRETRLRWLGHVVRREKSYVGRMQKFVVGRRRRGRPRRCWEDSIKEDLKRVGMKESGALDRSK